MLSPGRSIVAALRGATAGDLWPARRQFPPVERSTLAQPPLPVARFFRQNEEAVC